MRFHRALALSCIAASAVQACRVPRASDRGPAAMIDELADEYWQARLRDDPFEATAIGDRRFDDQVPDPRPAARAHHAERLRALRARIAGIASEALPGEQRVTRAQLLAELDAEVAAHACGLARWTIDPLFGPQVLLQNLPELQPVTDPDSGRRMLVRWKALPAYLDRLADNWRASARAGLVAPRAAIDKVVRQLDELLATRPDTWPLARPARVVRPSWPSAQAEAFTHDLDRAVAEEIAPALARLRDLLRDELEPVARPDDRAGLLHVPGGPACYAAQIRVHTSLNLDAQAIHEIGLEEIARIEAELTALGQRLFGVASLPELRARLRQPELHFATREEVETSARAALARATTALPRIVHRAPRTPCEVRRIEPFEERDATVAYYRPAAADGSRPGVYYVNTFAPTTRPRWEVEALAFHEAIPGHHLQVALAQELTGVPEFRKHLGVNAFIEGWALYAERLADELGLYSDDLSRLGMLSFDAWRAGRLVVDTGLHALGWTRQQAVDYLRTHTLLAEGNIENEVDRYIVWPGQALAYKLGQRELFGLRDRARAALGARFDLAAFHDQVLGRGALSLPVLRAELERWMAAGAHGRDAAK